MIESATIIRAITFDAAGTLVEPKPSVGAIYTQVAATFGVHANADEVQHAFVRAFRAATTSPKSPAPFDKPDFEQYTWWRGIVEHTFESTGHRNPFGSKFDEFYNELYERFALPEAWQIFPDVLPAMEQLHAANMPMAIISNWDNRLKRLISATPLAPYFRFVLTSAEAQQMKPNATIFHDAARRLHVAPHQLLHIGDAMREDVRGAREAGCHALQIDRAAASPDVSAIRSLGDIPTRLPQFR